MTLFNVPYTSGIAIRTSQSTFFTSSSKIVHFYLSNIDSNKLFFDVVSLLWASRLVQIYSSTPFDNTGGFWKLLSSFKNLKKQTLFIFWASRLVEIYSFTYFDKTGGFWKFQSFRMLKKKFCWFCELPAWWKSTHLPILTKLWAFESSKA